jgi:hypothetical protein
MGVFRVGETRRMGLRDTYYTYTYLDTLALESRCCFRWRMYIYRFVRLRSPASTIIV